MSWSMRKRGEAEFLDDFDGEVIKAGFIEGLVSAERSRSGKPVTTQQLFLLWKVLDQEAKEQPSWYSMGQRGFTFGGKTEKVTVGKKEMELYEKVTDGPELKKNSRAGLLLERLAELGWEPEEEASDECANAPKAFTGLQCHLMREKYEPGTRSTLDVERETLMPIAVIGKGAAAPMEEAEEVLLTVIVGKADKDVAEISKMDRIKTVGLTPAKIYKALDKMVAEGKLVKRHNAYYEA